MKFSFLFKRIPRWSFCDWARTSKVFYFLLVVPYFSVKVFHIRFKTFLLTFKYLYLLLKFRVLSFKLNRLSLKCGVLLGRKDESLFLNGG